MTSKKKDENPLKAFDVFQAFVIESVHSWPLRSTFSPSVSRVSITVASTSVFM